MSLDVCQIMPEFTILPEIKIPTLTSSNRVRIKVRKILGDLTAAVAPTVDKLAVHTDGVSADGAEAFRGAVGRCKALRSLSLRGGIAARSADLARGQLESLQSASAVA